MGFEPTRISPDPLKGHAVDQALLASRIYSRFRSLDRFHTTFKVGSGTSYFQTNPPANFSLPLIQAFIEVEGTSASLAAWA